MADTVLLGLQTASFRGVAFKFMEHQQTGGQKSINYEYPNQNQRFVQDLGTYQRIYQMNCYFNSQELDYYAQRQLFLSALNKPGIGILIHPYDGVVNVIAKPYNLRESIQELGYGVFAVQFVETVSDVFPKTSDIASAFISGQFTNFIQNSAGSLIGNFNVSNNSFNNLNYVTGTLFTAVSSSFSNVKQFAPNGSDNQQSEFNQALTSFNENTVTNAFDAQALSDSLENLFDKAGNLSDDLDERIAVIESLFGFSAAVPIDSTTTIEDERERNRLTIEQYVNSVALYFDYLFVSTQTFATEDDIEAKSQLLNDQFQEIVLNNTFTDVLNNKFEILGTQTFSDIEDARTQAHNYLNQLEVDSKRIVDVDIARASLLPFTFLYYGDLDLVDTLYDLNMVTNAANLSGEFKLLSDSQADIT